MDATTKVKAEIKAWERDFREQNGRNATVDDIKALPPIAEKYKLYKKLTKEASAKAAQDKQTPEPLKTPPRKRPTPLNAAPTAILPKPRPVASATDALTNNPFSPAKRKTANAEASSSSANPFLTPLKGKRAPSPDVSSPSPEPPLAPASRAVSKARKRLRGEPVSPSPKPREKRRRVDALNPQGNDVLASQSRSPSPQAEEGDSFVDDSPVKAPANGKVFMPLFEEANARTTKPLLQHSGKKTEARDRSKGFARAKTMPGTLFGSVKDSKIAPPLPAPDIFDADSPTGSGGATVNEKLKGKDREQSPDGTQKSRKKRVLPGPKGLIPGKDDLFETNQSAAASTSSVLSRAITSRKRSLSEATKDEKEPRTSDLWGLLPPSPPPADDNRGQKGYTRGKAKAKAMGKGKSKKAKFSSASSDEGLSTGDAEVRLVPWRGRPQSPELTNANETALALDPELRLHLRGRQADYPPQTFPLPEKFDVDLPEEMRKLLALSPNDRDRERKEESVVKGLLRGVRKVAGEVWIPGEIGGEGKESDEDVVVTEDDWEGEGVPWEVAEL